MTAPARSDHRPCDGSRRRCPAGCCAARRAHAPASRRPPRRAGPRRAASRRARTASSEQLLPLGLASFDGSRVGEVDVGEQDDRVDVLVGGVLVGDVEADVAGVELGLCSLAHGAGGRLSTTTWSASTTTGWFCPTFLTALR